MRVEVMEHYGLAQPIDQAGYYETAHHKQLIKDIRGAIHEGRLIAVCGVVGSGKTVTLRRLQQRLREENKITVARSLSIEKHNIKLATLINALFYDLTQDKQVQIPKQGERRERELQELVKKGKRPVALFVDEAHDLNGHTLIGLKRLMEVVEDGGGRLSVVLAGHPKLRNDLRRPTMEEIGYRTDIFTLDGITGSQREYIQWLLKTSMGKGKPEDILTADALADPPRDVRRTVMSTIWVRLMQSTYGRAAVAGVAAVLALTMWRTGALTFVTDHGSGNGTESQTNPPRLFEAHVPYVLAPGTTLRLGDVICRIDLV